MATEQEEKPDKFSQEFKRLDDKITDEITSKYAKEFEEMLRSDEWAINGDTFHPNMLNHKRLSELELLKKEEIDEEKDREKYIENYRKRACLLIKEMTPEKFDEVEYFPLENLITAWGRRTLRGFHLLDKSVRKETVS